MTRWVKILTFSIVVVAPVEYAIAAEAMPSTRQAILLTVTEQDYLLGEMHLNLEALGSVVGALAQNDARTAAQAAASRGMASYGDQDPKRPKALSAPAVTRAFGS
jgi:hypothetical protein